MKKEETTRYTKYKTHTNNQTKKNLLNESTFYFLTFASLVKIIK